LPVSGRAILAETLRVRRLGLVEYEPTWRAMRKFTAARDETTPDEIWLLEHPPVYTLGLSCKKLLQTGNDIPQIHIDRGGKMTYHGPGQLIVYFLVDMRRKKLGIRELVAAIEQSIISPTQYVLNHINISYRGRFMSIETAASMEFSTG